MATQGYRTKEFAVPVKRYCQTMDLKNDPELIEKYRECHSRAKAWPEIREGSTSDEKWKMTERMFYLYE